jgi:hypothetical protein
MRTGTRGAAALLVLTLVVGACGGGGNGKPGGDAGSPIGGSGGVPGGGGSTGSGTACLDRPGELPRPPAGGLPCDLIPPGLRL